MKNRKKVGIRRLKNEASRIIAAVGEERRDYVVTRRGRPVAVIRPWTEEDSTNRDRQTSEVLALFAPVARRVASRAGKRGASAAVARQRR